ncbi:hypothetical protein BM1_10854 [Bipolaris maydis]|nr:hypothetical protein BM1_10854 [Bipolaris maydis]
MYTNNPIQIGLIALPNGVSQFVFGAMVTALLGKFKRLKLQMITACTIQTIFCAVLATIVPKNVYAWSALQVFILGPFSWIVVLCYVAAGVNIPLQYLGLALGLIGTFRSMGGSVGNAIFNTILNGVVNNNLGSAIAKVALSTGQFDPANISYLIGATIKNAAGVPGAFATVPGITPAVEAASIQALRDVYAKGFRMISYSTIPFNVIAIVLALIMFDPSEYLTNHTAVRLETEHKRKKDVSENSHLSRETTLDLTIATPDLAAKTSREGRISLAIASYRNNPKQSIRALAKAYDVPQSTLHTRVHGTQPRLELRSVNRKLSSIEEQSLVQWILDLDRRGFPPHIIDVRQMADALLAARGQDPPPQPVGKKWVSRFIQSQPELQTKWSRRLNSQRAQYEDPATIVAWFKLVEETRQTYGVLDQDIYNFDETGFAMGVASTSKVVTSSDRVGRAVVVQPGNREWVTVIECVNASGWSLPPFVILSGKVHQSSWYHNLPPDWTIGTSDNGWTTDQLGVEWVKHFNQHTTARTAGVYRLLILDGHGSHATPEFDQYCTENKIITLCMPPHTSHLLQPLDVSCYSPLKRAYGREVEELARHGVYHVHKIDFLAAYTRIRPKIFTQQNIQAGFRATGLVPPCPDRVLSSLTVARTPSPPQTTTDNNTTAQAATQTETPHTVAELQQQVRYLQERLRRQPESPTSVAIRQLAKSAQLAMQSATILAEENKKLREENQRQRQKQDQQRQYIASGGVLQVQQAQQLVAEAERLLIEGSQNQAVNTQENGQESQGPEAQINREMDVESPPATPTQNQQTPSVFEIPILPLNKRYANFSPETTYRGRNPYQNTSSPKPIAKNAEQAIYWARDLILQASTMEESHIAQNKLLELLDVFRDYTETGRVANQITEKLSAKLAYHSATLANASQQATKTLKQATIAASNKAQPIAAQPTQKPAQSSYAAIAANNSNQAWTTVQPRKKQAQQAKKPASYYQTLVTLEDGQIISPLLVRNKINQAFQKAGIAGPVIQQVSTSRRNNLILTTTEGYSGEFLLKQVNTWQSQLPIKKAQPLESWTKLIVHGVPTTFDGAENLQLLHTEIPTYNKNQTIVGNPYWLSRSWKNKQTSSIVIAFKSEEEAKKIGKSTLQLAIELKVDIIAIQEPWIAPSSSNNYEAPRSIAHQSFYQIFPKVDPNLRPRALFYISRSLTAEVSQREEIGDHDAIAITIQEGRLKFNIYNVYNQKNAENIKTFQRLLANTQLPISTLLLIDANEHHPWWDPGCKTSQDGQLLADWIEDQDLSLLNTPGTATFFRPHLSRETTLDLTIATPDLAAKVRDWQTTTETGSDHYGILFSIQTTKDLVNSPTNQTRYNTKRADWDLFREELGKAIQSNAALQSLDQIHQPRKADSRNLLLGQDNKLKLQLDAIGEAITLVIQQAADKAIPQLKEGLKAKPWWNQELTKLRRNVSHCQRIFAQQLQATSIEEAYLFKRDFLLARTTYQTAIKRAKREHWSNFLEKEDPQSIFKAMDYTKEKRVERIPPIQGETLETSFKGKCKAFRKALFPPPPSTALPSFNNHQEKEWEWPALSTTELERACSNKVKSSSPGPDALSQDIITAAYQAQPNTFFKAYSLLFNYGYHPTCWRRATGAILKKPSKPDYSTPKAYRVITLLSCLGKVTERIIAKRLGYLAETTNLLHDSQIGGRLKKSAIDAALLLVDQIQHQKQQGYTTSTVFLDVKGAFDHVSHNQFLDTLKRLGLPISLITWAKTFLSNRSLRLAFDGQIEEFSEINAGIPQGSPVSPIFFLIYIRDLFPQIDGFQLSYIDDISITTSSTSIKKNVKILQREVNKLVTKGKQLAIEFDIAKTELIHYTKNKRRKEIPLELPSKEKIYHKDTIKWLGVYLDNKLSFREHVAIRASQAKTAFNRLGRLANIDRGLSPFAIRQLYLACVTSIADYGSPIYWRNQSFIKDQLQPLHNAACRKVLGVFKTAPAIPTSIEASLPSPAVRLSQTNRKYALRAIQLAPTHPITKAIARLQKTTLQQSKQPNKLRQLRAITSSIPSTKEIEEIISYRFRPWDSLNYNISISKKSKEEEAAAHKDYI